ncbi:conserved hypothetical protein [Thermoanaerobacter italicus Ab9]|uniref:Uncharacterized protein n=1 Tax=Thermoanaerobacter italicus (strain DSM 9252 / Ab9) TaxID=580331 RepID=D3T4J0_THEIA|nr:hypothetical protein [Thermoanaerobacter italicus]ADD03142.1 conserved hypothetical protein [Thermoanaerobacter italicus Ab9]
MKVVIQFCIDADIIDCPEHVIDRLTYYQNEFIDWLFDKKNDHPYWVIENGKKILCCYRSEAFVEWLNRFVLKDSPQKAAVVEKEITTWDENLPLIFF